MTTPGSPSLIAQAPSTRGHVLAQAPTEPLAVVGRVDAALVEPGEHREASGMGGRVPLDEVAKRLSGLARQDEGGAHVHLLEELRPRGDVFGLLGVGVAVNVERGHAEARDRGARHHEARGHATGIEAIVGRHVLGTFVGYGLGPDQGDEGGKDGDGKDDSARQTRHCFAHVLGPSWARS